MLKRWINNCIGLTGYQISRRPSLARDIARGKYRWLQNFRVATVLDVGANTGQFAAVIHKILPDAIIYAFEPLPDCFLQLEEQRKAIPGLHCINAALGEKDGDEDIYNNAFSPSSSLLTSASVLTRLFPQTKKAIKKLLELQHSIE